MKFLIELRTAAQKKAKAKKEELTPAFEKLFFKAIEEELEDYDSDRFKDFLAEMFRNQEGKRARGTASTSSASTSLTAWLPRAGSP